MPAPLMLLVIIPILGCLFSLFSKKNENNSHSVAIFTIISNILLVLYLFTQIDVSQMDLQLQDSFVWWKEANITLSFGIDTFALLLLLGIYVSVLIGLVGLAPNNRRNKSLMVLSLYYVWNITGFIVATDMISFYFFFAGMLLPLFMLVGLYGNLKKNQMLYRFFIYNFIGILLLLAATLIIYKFYHGNVALNEIAFVGMPKRRGVTVWLVACLAFVSRIPVWPFHYWISSISSGIKNPLVYVINNTVPLTGVYGFIRFWPLSMPESVNDYIPIIEIFCIVTMLFIALIGFVHKEFLYKLFAYSTVYYLLFLLAVILPTDTLKMNIAYSLFTFLIVTSSMVVLNFRIEQECVVNNCEYRGILVYMPKLARFLVVFVLVAIGLPVSSLFWNNFILLSAIFRENFSVGVWVMMAISLVALVMMYELYVMRDLQHYSKNSEKIEDISGRQFFFFTMIIGILLMSFFDPLWFVF